MVPEYLGKFPWEHINENFTRTWCLWAIYDELGEVVCIRLGISENLSLASGELRRSDCTLPHQQYAFALAEQWVNTLKADECEVIELDKWRH